MSLGNGPHLGIYVGSPGFTCGDELFSWSYNDDGDGPLQLTHVSGASGGQWTLTGGDTIDTIFVPSPINFSSFDWYLFTASFIWSVGNVYPASGTAKISWKRMGTVPILTIRDSDFSPGGTSNEDYPDTGYYWQLVAESMKPGDVVAGTLRLQGCQSPPS